jgi:hypothetical protein
VKKNGVIFFSLPFKISNDSGLQWFQYRINHRIIATNSLLLKMKLKDNELCSFCKNEIESLEHMFWFCPIINNLIFSNFEKYGNFRSLLNCCNFILGLKESNSTPINMIFLSEKIYLQL